MPSQRPPYLLLIEDHSELANATAEFLGSMGLEVRIAGSGTQALKTAQTFPPQIVLCDLSLPDMSGLEVVRQLRADPKTRNALFAITTAMAQADIVMLEESLAGEVDLFLSKPITDRAVNELLDRLADQRS